MRIGPFMLDTDIMTCEMVNSWITELKKVRARKAEGDDFVRTLNALIENVQEAGFDFLCRDTGEVLDPKYWELYDNRAHCPHVSNDYKMEDEE